MSRTPPSPRSSHAAAVAEIADRVAQNVVALDLDDVEPKDVLAAVTESPYLYVAHGIAWRRAPANTFRHHNILFPFYAGLIAQRRLESTLKSLERTLASS